MNSLLINEYLISEKELNALNQMLNDDEKKVHVLQKNLLVSKAQYAEARTFFTPYFEKLLITAVFRTHIDGYGWYRIGGPLVPIRWRSWYQSLVWGKKIWSF